MMERKMKKDLFQSALDFVGWLFDTPVTWGQIVFGAIGILFARFIIYLFR
jgi:hypothetical protein